MSGARSRNKGATFERVIARRVSEWWGAPARRTPMSGAYGAEWDMAGDIMVRGRCPLHFELKNRESWNIDQLLSGTGPAWGWWRRTVKDATAAGKAPVLVLKRNQRPAYAMVGSDLAHHVATTTPRVVLRSGPSVVLVTFEALCAVPASQIRPMAQPLQWYGT